MKWRLSLILVISIISLHAQLLPDNAWQVKGEIESEGRLPDNLSVEVRSLGGGASSDRAVVMPDGTFRLRNLRDGQYEVRITNLRGDLLSRQLVGVNSGNLSLTLHLPQGSPPSPPGGKISARKLAHRVSPQALKEFVRSQKAQDVGDIGGSISHLQKALSIDPDYAEALNNLGVRYMALGQYDKAKLEFEKSAELDDGSASIHVNLSWALSMLHDSSGAEAAARLAVGIEPQSPAAHYALGYALATQGTKPREALDDLRKAAERYPKARLMAAQLLVRRGAVSGAADELRRYLETPKCGASERSEGMAGGSVPATRPAMRRRRADGKLSVLSFHQEGPKTDY